MSPGNTQKLFDAFPQLYRGRNKPQESSMHWGFECGDGWFDLLLKLSQAIEDEAKKIVIGPMSEAWPEALQVKQKFGSLRFHLENATPAMERLIEEASKASTQTCQVCGAQARIFQHPRSPKVLCNNHASQAPAMPQAVRIVK